MFGLHINCNSNHYAQFKSFVHALADQARAKKAMKAKIAELEDVFSDNDVRINRIRLTYMFRSFCQEMALIEELSEMIATRYNNKKNPTYIIINTTLDAFAAQVRSLNTGTN